MTGGRLPGEQPIPGMTRYTLPDPPTEEERKAYQEKCQHKAQEFDLADLAVEYHDTRSRATSARKDLTELLRRLRSDPWWTFGRLARVCGLSRSQVQNLLDRKT